MGKTDAKVNETIISNKTENKAKKYYFGLSPPLHFDYWLTVFCVNGMSK